MKKIQEIKEQVDKLIGQIITIPVIDVNSLYNQNFIVEKNKIINDKLCITYFKDSKYCCNSDIVLNPQLFQVINDENT